MAMKRRGALARLGGNAPAIGELFSIVKELSFDDLRDEAQLPPRLLLIGEDAAGLTALRDLLGGEEAAGFIETATFEELPAHLDAYDGIVLINAAPAQRALPRIARLLNDTETAGRTLTFQMPPGNGPDGRAAPAPQTVDDLRSRLLTRLSHRQLALGRYLPAFRRPAAMALINAASRANAEFALLSNIPTLLPIVGNIMAVGADFLVLTKNQLMLIYKLAAINGQDIGQPWRLYSEMLPVVGAGLVWRTAARELASLIPFAGGTIPKMLVAYAGTMATGQAANFYYEQGTRASGEQLKGFYARALETAKRLGLTDRNRPDNVIEGRFTEKDPEPARPAPPQPSRDSRQDSPPTRQDTGQR